MSQARKDLMKEIIERSCGEYTHVSEEVLDELYNVARGTSDEGNTHLERIMDLEEKIQNLTIEVRKIDRRLG